MIEFHYKTDFQLEDEAKYADWVSRIIASEDGSYKQVDYIFASDNYLLDLNKKYLSHDTFTDIITFDYSDGKRIAGDIFISIDRVRENAELFKVELEKELLRVMSHGLLHLFGYGDKSEKDISLMRMKEDEKIKLFHVEQ